jgi:hypothetical protein
MEGQTVRVVLADRTMGLKGFAVTAYSGEVSSAAIA